MQVLLRERLRVTAAAALILRDVHAADDVFQQVVLAALQTAESFGDPNHLIAWGLRAARHRAVDSTRRRKAQYLSDDVLDLLEGPAGCDHAAESSERVDALHQCLDQLGDAARDLLRCRYDEGLTAQAISTRLHRSTDAVYQSLSRTHRQLRDCIERKLAVVPKAET